MSRTSTNTVIIPGSVLKSLVGEALTGIAVAQAKEREEHVRVAMEPLKFLGFIIRKPVAQERAVSSYFKLSCTKRTGGCYFESLKEELEKLYRVARELDGKYPFSIDVDTMDKVLHLRVISGVDY